MKLNPIKSNMTEVEIGNKTILFSYKTPVAYAVINGGIGNGMTYFKTNKQWSQTTTKHINQWLTRYGQLPFSIKEIDQSELDNLIK